MTTKQTMHFQNPSSTASIDDLEARMQARRRRGGMAGLVLAALAAAAGAQDAPAPSSTAPESPFLTSLEQGFARAKAERKLLFVDLHHPL